MQKLLSKYFQDVDMIIHAGDYVNIDVVTTIRNFKHFAGVWGNVDSPDVKEILKEKEILSIAGYRIGVWHGHGKEMTTMDRAYAQFKNDDVDIIIFGHSHQPVCKTQNGILMINPGSIINKRRERWYSYAILGLTQNGISACIHYFNV